MVSILGDQFRIWSVVYWVFTTSHQSPVAQSLVLIAEILPVALLGPLAGVWVDRWNRKRVMVWSDLIRAGISFGLVAAMMSGSLWLVLLLLLASSAVSTFFQPASGALIPALLPPEHLMAANSLSQSTRTVMILLGPAAGTILYQLAGPSLALTVDAVSFLIAAGCAMMIQYAGQKVSAGESSLGWLGFWRTFAAGIRFGWENATVRSIFVMLVVMSLALGAVNTLGIFLVTQELLLPESYTALAGTAQGIGMFSGAIAMGALSKRVRAYNWLTVIGAGVLTVGIGVFAAAPNIIIVMMGRLLLGAGATGLSIAITTLFQLAVPEEMLGRVGATLEAAPTLAMLGAAGVSGYAVQWVGTRAVLGTAGGISLMAGLVVMVGLGCLRSRPSLPQAGAVAETLRRGGD